jgi:hypothetical protein
LPTVRLELEIDTVALPFNATGAPAFVPSITNCTVPVGVPALDVTMAVNVTLSPSCDGLPDDITLVELDATAMAKTC